MPQKKMHYYPCDGPVDENGFGHTACGLPGRETGGLIAGFFGFTKKKERCKICNKQFEKDQKIFENKA